MASPNMKSALHYCSQRAGLTPADQAHLRRWLAEVDDPIWEKIANDIRRYGEYPLIVEGPYSAFISSAMRSRQSAAIVASPTIERKRTPKKTYQERQDLSLYAQKIDDLIREYGSFEEHLEPKRPPDPDIHPQPLSADRLEAESSLNWLRKTAQKLREVQVKSFDENSFYMDVVPVTASRQNRKGVKRQIRTVGVFMKYMVNFMHLSCGTPNYEAVAALTNIAFPDADVVAETVRSVCKPTTRAGRRRTSGTPVA